MLYVLFAADLIEFLEEVAPMDGPVLLDGKASPALQFADDRLLLAHSERDLNLLLARWGKYCDRTHQVPQAKKTMAMVFTFEEDGSLPFAWSYSGSARVGDVIWSLITKNVELGVSAIFDYLGIRTHWRERLEAAWKERDMKRKL